MTATTVINSLQLRSREIAQLSIYLQTNPAHLVSANLYLTPHGSRRLGLHFDDDDVLSSNSAERRHGAFTKNGPLRCRFREHRNGDSEKSPLRSPNRHFVLLAATCCAFKEATCMKR